MITINMVFIFLASEFPQSDLAIKDKGMSNKGSLAFIYFVLGSCIFVSYRENLDESIEKELALKVHKQNETALMMDNLQEALLIKSENKIDSINQNFLILF